MADIKQSYLGLKYSTVSGIVRDNNGNAVAGSFVGLYLRLVCIFPRSRLVMVQEIA